MSSIKKLIAVGDIHGRDFWKKVAEKEKDFDMFVFVGDYFDNFPNRVTEDDIVQNFFDIAAFKRDNSNKVTVLLGNHDFQYMAGAGGQICSGFNRNVIPKASALLHSMHMIGHVQVCYQYNDLLFSHAGFTKTWTERSGIDIDNIEMSVNGIFHSKPEFFRYSNEDKSGFGEHISQGPFWVRTRSLYKDMIDGYIQVVGHTGFDKITSIEDRILCLDAPSSQEYLTVIDGVIDIAKL